MTELPKGSRVKAVVNSKTEEEQKAFYDELEKDLRDVLEQCTLKYRTTRLTMGWAIVNTLIRQIGLINPPLMSEYCGLLAESCLAKDPARMVEINNRGREIFQELSDLLLAEALQQAADGQRPS